MEAELYLPYNVCCFGKATTKLVASLGGRTSVETTRVDEGYTSVLVEINGSLRRIQLLSLGHSDEALSERNAQWAHAFLFDVESLSEGSWVTTFSKMERMIGTIKKGRVNMSSLFLSPDDVRCGFVFCRGVFDGPSHDDGDGDDLHQLASREQCPLIEGWPSWTIDVLVGTVDCERPLPLADSFFEQRSSLVSALNQLLRDADGLTALVSHLKQCQAKPALDVFLECGTALQDESGEVLCSKLVERYGVLNATTPYPYVVPFVLRKLELLSSHVAARRKSALCSVQEEMLQVMFPLIARGTFNIFGIALPTTPTVGGGGGAAPSPSTPVLSRSSSSSSPSMVIRSKNISPLERVLILDPVHWKVLKALLERRHIELKIPSSSTSVSSGGKEKKKSKGNAAENDADSSEYVWECVDRVFSSYGLAGDFGAFLVEEEIMQIQQPNRLFREDSVASKWLSRKASAFRDAIKDSIYTCVKDICKSELPIGDDLGSSLLLVHPLLEQIIRIDVPLSLRLPLARVRLCCQKRGIDPLPVMGRLFLLRWVGPLITSPQAYGIVSKPLTPAQQTNFTTVSKILIHIGEQTVFQDDNPLSAFNPWMRSVVDMFCERLKVVTDEHAIEERKKQFDHEKGKRLRKRKEFQVMLATLRDALQSIRNYVEFPLWNEVLREK